MLHPIELTHWLQTRLNRPLAHAPDEAFWGLYEHAGQPLSSCPAELQRRAKTDLLVVLTTYGRPESCARVLVDLHAALHQPREALQSPPATALLVLNDRGEADYRETRALATRLFGADLTWLDARARLGKPGFWKAYQTIFLAARTLSPEHALFLQDDLAFAPTLLQHAFAQWRVTADDARRRVLYLFSSADDERWGRWTTYLRRRVTEQLSRTQWFDLQAFFVDRAFFDLLAYRMVPVHENRWRRRPSVSSGVGRQLTIRLRGRANVYQCRPALVRHGAAPSHMNPKARARRPLDNRSD